MCWWGKKLSLNHKIWGISERQERETERKNWETAEECFWPEWKTTQVHHQKKTSGSITDISCSLQKHGVREGLGRWWLTGAPSQEHRCNPARSPSSPRGPSISMKRSASREEPGMWVLRKERRGAVPKKQLVERGQGSPRSRSAPKTPFSVETVIPTHFYDRIGQTADRHQGTLSQNKCPRMDHQTSTL